MLFIKYLIALFLGFITGTFILMPITIICRVGFPLCKSMVIVKDCPVEIAKLQRNKYIISLIIQICIYIFITFICYKFIYSTFLTYLISSILVLIFNIPQTGKTEINANEFYNNLMITKNQYYNKIKK